MDFEQAIFIYRKDSHFLHIMRKGSFLSFVFSLLSGSREERREKTKDENKKHFREEVVSNGRLVGSRAITPVERG